MSALSQEHGREVIPLILFAVNNAINVQHTQHLAGLKQCPVGGGEDGVEGANETQRRLALARINAANLRLSMV